MSLTSSDATGDRIVKTLSRVVYDGTNLRGWVQCISEAMQRLDISHMLASEASRTAVASHDKLKDSAADKAIDLTQLPDEAGASVHSQGGGAIKQEQKVKARPPSGTPSLPSSPRASTATQASATASTPSSSSSVEDQTGMNAILIQMKAMAENMQRLELKLQAAESKLPATASEGNTLNSMADTRMADKLLTQELSKHCTFAYQGVQETNSMRCRRLTGFAFMIETLPRHRSLKDRVYYGDVRALFILVCKDGRMNDMSAFMVLNKRLVECHKKLGQGLDSFETELSGMLQESDAIGHQHTEKQRLCMLLQGVGRDTRYKHDIRDLMQVANLSYSTALKRLRTKATQLKDLHGKPRAPLRQRAEAHGVDSGKAVNKRRSSKPGRPNGKPKQGGARGAICPYFLRNGSCLNGDDCRNQHVTLDDLNRSASDRRSNRPPQGGGRNPTKGGGAQRRAVSFNKKNDTPRPPCFQFREKGKCSKGDHCAFSHDMSEASHVSAVSWEDPQHPAQVLGMPNKEEFFEYMSMYGLGECNAAEASAVLPNQPCRGPELGPPLKTGVCVVVCLPGTPVDAKRAQVLGMSTSGKYTLHLIDDEHVPMRWVDALAEHGVRSDDCYLLPRTFAGQPIRASESHKSDIAECNMVEGQAFKARAIVDSGASGAHYCTHAALYEHGSLKLADKPKLVSPPFGAPCWLKYSGTLVLKSNCDSTERVLLPDTYYAPQWRRTLISVSNLDDAGYYADFGGGGLRIRKGAKGASICLLPRAPELGSVLGRVPVRHMSTRGPVVFGTHPRGRNGLYPVPDACLNAEDQGAAEANSVAEVNLASTYREGSEIEHLHDALAHASDSTIMLMMRHDGKQFTPEELQRADKARWCTSCGIGKAHNSPYNDRKLHLDNTILSYVAADLKTSKGPSTSGFVAYLCIYERRSHKKFSYLLRARSEGSQYLMWWMNRAHTLHHPHRIKYLYMDSGELRTTEVKAACKATGTQLNVNLRSAHKQNPEGEIQIKLVDQAEKAARARGGAPPEWWEFSLIAVTTAMGVLPRVKELRKLKDRSGAQLRRPDTPDEVWLRVRYGSYKSQYTKCIPPFCLCVAHVNVETRAKRDNPGFEAIYLCPLAESLIQRKGATVREGCVEMQRGHLVFRISDGVYVSVRTVYANVSKFPMVDNRGKLEHLDLFKPRSYPALDASAAPEPNVTEVTSRFAPGTAVMTAWGRALVHKVYSGGALELTWPDGDEPNEHYSMLPHEVWQAEPGEQPPADTIVDQPTTQVMVEVPAEQLPVAHDAAL